MSFFTRGFGKKRAVGGEKKDKKEKKEDKKKDKGEWEMLTDAYGRSYWRHTVTGEVSGGLVSPVSTINPSPIGYPGGMVFTPSPVPAGFAPAPTYVVAPPLNGKKEKKEKKEGKREAYWEEVYDKDGDKFWKHTITKKTTYRDPYM